MSADAAPLEWPRDLLDDEEQDEPLAGQDHRLTIDSIFYPLYSRFRSADCFVAAELRVHRNPLNLRDWREPDVMLALGVPDRVRRRYPIWEERKAPDLVVEVLSPSSADNGDLVEKRRWYRAEGMREYVVIDPNGDFAPEPRLQAWRFGDLAGTAAGAVDHVVADADGILRSRVVEVGWVVQGEWVRLVDLATGALLPAPWEMEGRLRAEIAAREDAQAQALLAEERLQAEMAARRQAEERAGRLAAEQARLRRMAEGDE